MRRPLLLLALIALAATPSLAQEPPHPMRVITPPPAKSLRGPLSPGDALAEARLAASPGARPARTAGEIRAELELPRDAATPAIATPATAPQDAGQCRAACAQTYYFCAAAGTEDDCAPTWSQCRAGCGVAANWRAASDFSGR